MRFMTRIILHERVEHAHRGPVRFVLVDELVVRGVVLVGVVRGLIHEHEMQADIPVRGRSRRASRSAQSVPAAKKTIPGCTLRYFLHAATSASTFAAELSFSLKKTLCASRGADMGTSGASGYNDPVEVGIRPVPRTVNALHAPARSHTPRRGREPRARRGAFARGRERRGREVLRFWELPTLAVVLGSGGSVAIDVNVAACDADGVPILRRASGGGTVLLGPGCLCFSLVLELRPCAGAR